jgi:signal transduction histidine kinase
MMPKSIKWRLQLWYGLILVAVLAGLGITAYQLERSRVYRQVDDEIHRRMGALGQVLHGPPDDRLPPPLLAEGDSPPPDFAASPRPPRRDRDSKFELPPRVAALFGTNDPNNAYFRVAIVTDHGEKEIARSDNYRQRSGEPPVMPSYHPFDPQQNRVNTPALRTSGPGGPPGNRPPAFNAGDDRIAEEFLPAGEFIEVGCSIAPELQELRRTALSLTAMGAWILLVGMAGGWWFVGRALRPIADISATAAKISAGDLSQRINSTEAESELGQLTAVLNSTFARLETAFAQQKQFASDAAHELRTPVTVILTQTQMTLGRERDAAGYKQTVEACQRAAQRMRKLIESLLELARFDAGQEVLTRLRFNLAPTVCDCVALIQPLAAERRVKITAQVEPVEIKGDAERLAQVATNLLANAVQYNRPDGEVRISLTRQAGLAVLEIADSGVGIAPEDLPRVFERFFRADKSRTGGGNTGLGLSICKAIVEAHGGTIEVSSQPNVGTKFVVRLPVEG